jgi:hypothetical protein
MGRLPARSVSTGRRTLEALWVDVEVVEITPQVAQAAADAAEQHGLRGYDAVHLVSALHKRARMCWYVPTRTCFGQLMPAVLWSSTPGTELEPEQGGGAIEAAGRVAFTRGGRDVFVRASGAALFDDCHGRS